MTDGAAALSVEPERRARAARWIPGSLGGRLLFGASLLVAIAILASTFVGATLLERFARGQIDAGLDARIIAVASGLTSRPTERRRSRRASPRRLSIAPGPDGTGR